MTDILTTTESGSYESKAEANTSRPEFVARWLAEIELASKGEEIWRKEAEESREIYRAENKGAGQRFNIHFSNVQTAVPALYNSTPTPDVRTRYADDNEISRMSGQAIERILSYSVDTYDFDSTIKSAVQDRELAGRGQARVRFVPMVHEGKVYQEVNSEHVPWKHYRMGPANRWEDVPWNAFEHFLTREQLIKLTEGTPLANVGHNLRLDMTIAEGTDHLKTDSAPSVFKRARVWEIWDKLTRKVLWIAPAYADAPIREDDDPLGLIGFFPAPAPLYAIKTTDTMVPKCPYVIIKPLVEELEDITVRIQALIRVCKWRGFRHPLIPFDRLETAEDGELVAPLDGAELLSLVQGGGLDKFIWLMPIDQLIKTLQQLYLQREQIKQTIFEVSGLADIMRGQTDPNETLGAQQIKANFGTMRMQDGQKEVQRFCRDIFRIKAEIACNKFDSQNLAMMTGLNLPSRQDVMAAKQRLMQMQQMAASGPAPMGQPGMPPQNGGGMPQEGQIPPPNPQPPPQPDPQLVALAQAEVTWDDVLGTLKSGVMRTYRIDVETDSTIRGDTSKAQQTASLFMQGTGQFFTAMAPVVQAGAMPMDVAVDLYSSLVRTCFRMGKQAEDALARWGQEVTKKAKNPAPPQPSPDELKLQAEERRHQAELAFKQQAAQQDAQLRQQEFAHTAKLKEAEFAHSTKLEEFKATSQAQLAQTKLGQDMALKQNELGQQRELAGSQAALEHEKLAHASKLKEAEFAHGAMLAQQSSQMEREKIARQFELEGKKAATQAQGEANKLDATREANQAKLEFEKDKHAAEMEFDWEMAHRDAALEEAKFAADADGKPTTAGSATAKPAAGPRPARKARATYPISRHIDTVKDDLKTVLSHALAAAEERHGQALAAQREHAQALVSAFVQANQAPRKLLRNEQGRAVGVETGHGRFAVTRDAAGRAVGLEPMQQGT